MEAEAAEKSERKRRVAGMGRHILTSLALKAKCTNIKQMEQHLEDLKGCVPRPLSTERSSAEHGVDACEDCWKNWKHWDAGTCNTPNSTSPPGDVRVSGRANTLSWVCRGTDHGGAL